MLGLLFLEIYFTHSAFWYKKFADSVRFQMSLSWASEFLGVPGMALI
ncbi:MAG: hypothetical protein KIC94_12720 [Clostridiales bacterium]|nr:hypothetical protein [Clostridiales bacterium]